MSAYYALMQRSPSHWDVAMRKLNETVFSFFFEGRGLKTGGGTVIIKMIPLENPEDGVWVHTMPIKIT